jgi:Flp pilus assembly protein TadB
LVLLIAIVVLTIGLCVTLGVLLWGIIVLAVVFGTIWLWWPRRHPGTSR